MASNRCTSLNRWITRREMANGIVEWTIDDFSSINMAPGKYLESPHFVVQGNDDVKWFMRIYPSGRSDEYKDSVSINMNYISRAEESVTAQFQVTLSNVDKKLNRKRGNMKELEFCSLKPSWGFDDFIKRDLLGDGFLRNNQLHLTCKMNVLSKHTTVSQVSAIEEQKHELDSYLMKKLATAYESQKYTDVILKIKGLEIRAHKAILAVSSDVFEAMFIHNEMESGVVYITNVRYDAMQKLVQFLYTGKVESFDNAEDLLDAANKYNIEPLITMCELHMVSILSVDNVVHFLQISGTYNARLLKAQALSFAAFHIKDILKRFDWQMLEGQYPQIANEVLNHALVQKKDV